MPWKDNYTITDERSLTDDEVRWPDSQRCCVAVTVDLSLASRPAGLQTSDVQNPGGLFGLREGLDLMLKLFDELHIKATFAVPGVMTKILASTLTALQAEGHEIAANGFRHEDVSQLERGDEKERIEATTEILGEAIGRSPSGWYSLPRAQDPFAVGTISPNTMDLLIDAGYQYMGNGLSDDIPHYWVTHFESRRTLLTLPYYYHFDDQFFLMFPRRGTGLEHADTLFANWMAEFDAQYARERYFNMTLHPHAIGWCNRLELLTEFLAHVCDCTGVWNATGTQVADYWLDTYPASTHLRLEPSIWQDYPGSLS